MKKVGELLGQGKKQGSQHKYLSCMVIFHCNDNNNNIIIIFHFGLVVHITDTSLSNPT